MKFRVIIDKNKEEEIVATVHQRTDLIKDFEIRCCEAGKISLAPLAATMVKHFFSWIICMLQ